MSMLAVAGLAATLVGAPPTGADMVKDHVAALQKAQSIKVSFTVQNIPAAAQEYKLELSRPGMLRFSGPNGYVLTNGSKVWEYMKADNQYTESNGGVKEAIQAIDNSAISAWVAFFTADQFKGAKSITAGSKLNMKGTPVTPVAITFANDLTCTLFVDSKLGFARGSSVRKVSGTTSVETLVISTDLQVGEAMEVEAFAFNAPSGASKVEISAGDMDKWYDDLEEGFKIAKATNRMVFLKFGAEWCGPCKAFERDAAVSAEFKAMGKYYVFVHIDTDYNKSLASSYGVSGIPDFRYLKADRTEVDKQVGYGGIGSIISKMESAKSR